MPIARFTANVRRSSTAAQVFGLTAAAIESAGGVNGFAAAFKRHYDACPPGSRRALDMLFALLKLTELCQPPPVELMTDEELEAEMKRCQLAR